MVAGKRADRRTGRQSVPPRRAGRARWGSCCDSLCERQSFGSLPFYNYAEITRWSGGFGQSIFTHKLAVVGVIIIMAVTTTSARGLFLRCGTPRRAASRRVAPTVLALALALAITADRYRSQH